MQHRGAAAVAAILALAGAALGTKMAVDAARPKGDDREQLARMLLDAEAAVERKDPAGVNRFISADYKDNVGMSGASIRYQVADYLRHKQAIQLSIPERSIDIRVNPDGQTGTVRFHVSARLQGESGSNKAELEMALQVQKEPVHYYLFFPGQEWRVINAEGYSPLEGI